jgi:RNA polymerase sigma-70 factor (ECF subfamily)
LRLFGHHARPSRCYVDPAGIVSTEEDAANRKKVTVDRAEWAAAAFTEHRAHLHAVAYRMLGSLTEADDAVQETWLRLARADSQAVRDLRAWLTTVVSRVCLDMLRARAARREDLLGPHLPDPIVAPESSAMAVGAVTAGVAGPDPEASAVLADSVGLALLVVLDTLAPAERLAFVLHDIFAVPFERIGPILDRSPVAAKQLASRARRRLRAAGPPSRTGDEPADLARSRDPAREHAVVDAFLAAAREGDFDALLAVLHPDVVLRGDAGDGPLGPSQLIRGAAGVVTQARRFAALRGFGRRVLVNGGPGVLVARSGQPLALMGFTVADGKIVEIDILADPVRLAALDLSAVLSTEHP